MIDQNPIPEDIEHILEYTAEMAKGYGNALKWNEIAKLKSDMMKHLDRWKLVTPSQVKSKCLSLGMTDDDATEISDMLKKRLDGRKLVPHRTYRDFEFNHKK